MLKNDKIFIPKLLQIDEDRLSQPSCATVDPDRQELLIYWETEGKNIELSIQQNRQTWMIRDIETKQTDHYHFWSATGRALKSTTIKLPRGNGWYHEDSPEVLDTVNSVISEQDYEVACGSHSVRMQFEGSDDPLACSGLINQYVDIYMEFDI